uniref:Uncharacterized protein n=1 Tax=Arundo donax TaxID=35708 RepID=A0A0A9DW72_ARUDO
MELFAHFEALLTSAYFMSNNELLCRNHLSTSFAAVYNAWISNLLFWDNISFHNLLLECFFRLRINLQSCLRISLHNCVLACFRRLLINLRYWHLISFLFWVDTIFYRTVIDL